METELHNLLLQSKGKIDNYVFIASTSYDDKLKEFQGIPIYYTSLIEIGRVMYCISPFYNS